MSSRPLRIAAVALGLGSWLPHADAQSVHYVLQEVHPPFANLITQVNAINETGHAAGVTYSSFPDDAQGFVLVGTTYTPLVPLPDAVTTVPNSVFDNGRIVGFSGNSSTDARAAVFDMQGVPLELRTLPGHTFSVAAGGNAHRVIVGAASNDLFGGLDQPVRWVGGVLYALPLPVGSAYGAATAVNNHETIAASAWNNVGVDEVGYLVYSHGHLESVPPQPGAPWSRLFDINDAGQAVGQLTDEFGFPLMGFYFENSVVTPIPPVTGDPGALLTDVNRQGLSCGISLGGTFGIRAVVCNGAEMFDLNELLDPVSGAGWTILVAQDINNKGQIAGNGFDPGGAISGFVLTPMAGPPDGSAQKSAPRPVRPAALPQAFRDSLNEQYRLKL
jgi:hypothetical protein